MKRVKNKTLTIILLVLAASITLSITNYAQEKPAEKKESKEEPVVYKISEIPPKLEETQAYLLKISTDIISPEKLEKGKKELNDVNESYRILRAQTDSIDLEGESSTTLKEFQQKWISQKGKVSNWSDKITGSTEKLEETKKELITRKEIWERTYQSAGEGKAPRDLMNSIQGLAKSINNVEAELTGVLNSFLSLQTALSEQNININLTLTRIDELLKEKERKVFIRNAPPVWESFSVTKDTAALTVQLSKIWNSYIRTTTEFIESNKDKLILDFVLFLVFLLVVYVLRYFTRNLKEKDENVTLSLKLLERPVSVAIMVFLFGVFIYQNVPEVLINVLRILVVLPFLRILFHILKPVLRIPLIYFCTLIVLQQFMITAGSGTTIERTLLIVLSILAIAGLWMLLDLKITVRAFDNEVTTARLTFISKLALSLFIIGLSANVFGYVMLNFVIINGVLNSTYGIILLLTSVLAINALIMLALQTNLLQKFNVVKNEAGTIKNTITKIIKAVVFIWSLLIITKNFLIKDEVIEWLGEFLSQVWKIGNLNISIGNILLFFISIWIAVQTARFVRFILERDVLPRLNLARGIPGTISSISTYVIIGFGIIIAMVTAGVDLSSFALLAGALGVGIGFGLQDLVRNFISGLILIFERPIQIGDAVQVDDLSGRVLKIGIRSSIIKTWEGAEVIVPNGNLISNKLINWTLSDQLRRIDIKVGVAYGSDIALVMKTLLKCATDHEMVLASPAPNVLFNDFGNSSLDFELRCWTSNFSNWVIIRSEIRVSIDKEFIEQKITIPFPQRDLHIKSGIVFPDDAADNKGKAGN